MTRCEKCGKVLRKDWHRFCSWECSGEWATARSAAFGRAGKPRDGVTYGKGADPKKPKGGPRESS